MRTSINRQTPAFGRLIVFVYLLGLSLPALYAQTSSAKWQQVMRGEGFLIDVDTTSLTLSETGTVGATFRMTYSGSEFVGGTKFKSRLDSYEFDVRGRNYRAIRSRYFDSGGREISIAGSSNPNEWKPVTPTSVRLIEAALKLSPFGVWKVITYRYSDGTGPMPDDGPGVSSFKNSLVSVGFDAIRAGKGRCDNPSLELRTMQASEIEKRLLTRLRNFGIDSNQVRTLFIKCNSATSLMFLLSTHSAVLMWDGLFLSIEREDRSGFSFPPLIIN